MAAMMDASNSDRLEAALDGDGPADAALRLAVELRDAGVSQAELLALFESSRARHRNDADERRHEAVLDVMDFIVGWCSPERRVFPPEAGASKP